MKSIAIPVKQPDGRQASENYLYQVHVSQSNIPLYNSPTFGLLAGVCYLVTFDLLAS